MGIMHFSSPPHSFSVSTREISWFLVHLLGSQEISSRSSAVFLPQVTPGTPLFNSMKARIMHNSLALVKQEFLDKWIKGLQIYSDFNKEMTILERKKAIKLSADVAIASTRNASTHWSRALMAGAATKSAVEQILGRQGDVRDALNITCRNKILRGRCSVVKAHKKIKARRAVRSSVKAISIAKKLVKSRTRVLKRLVPGGQDMDEACLIKETLDYIASLRVQVDVMRHLAAAAGGLDTQQRSL